MQVLLLPGSILVTAKQKTNRRKYTTRTPHFQIFYTILIRMLIGLEAFPFTEGEEAQGGSSPVRPVPDCDGVKPAEAFGDSAPSIGGEESFPM